MNTATVPARRSASQQAVYPCGCPGSLPQLHLLRPPTLHCLALLLGVALTYPSIHSSLAAAGSAFLGILAAAPALVESLTGLQAFRGFAGTSVLILVGVATDTARKFRAELAMQKYKDIDKMYDDL